MRIRPLFLALALFLLIHGTAFADGGNILGTAYVEGQPTADICVDVLDGDNAVASQKSNQGGDFNIYIANPGWYTVRFSDCGIGYTSVQTSSAEVVSDQDTPGVNGYLSSAGRVAGKLKDNLAAVLTGACVKAEDQNGNSVEIGSGELVRTSRDIEVFNYGTGSYQTLSVEGVQRSGSSVEIEVYDYDSGEYPTLDMDAD